jgi:hypothetical protein
MAYTICEPSTEGQPYDKHQFDGRFVKMSSATSCLSYQDIRSMQNKAGRSFQAGKQSPTPKWVLDEKSFREVILCYAERRNLGCYAERRSLGNGAKSTYLIEGTNAERLTVTRERETDAILPLRFKLQSAQNRYTAAVKAGESQAVLDKLTEVIAHHDTEVMVAIRGSHVLATSVAYLYYRCGYNSVQVATHLRIKPCAVRQVINRMNQVWTAISGEYPESRYAPGGKMHRKPKPGREKKLQQLFVLRAAGNSFKEIAKMMKCGESSVQHNYKRYFAPLHDNTKGERTLRITRDETGTRLLYTRVSTN